MVWDDRFQVSFTHIHQVDNILILETSSSEGTEWVPGVNIGADSEYIGSATFYWCNQYSATYIPYLQSNLYATMMTGG